MSDVGCRLEVLGASKHYREGRVSSVVVEKVKILCGHSFVIRRPSESRVGSSETAIH